MTKVIETLTQEGLPWGLLEVVGTVEQGNCSRRRLLRRGLEFHACTINKSAHTKKKSGNLFNDLRIYYIYIYIHVNVQAHTHTHTHTHIYIYTYIYI